MLQRALKALRPTPQIRMLLWLVRYCYNERGHLYDHGLYPHFGAPGGPADAVDYQRIRTIWLQFGIRLGKTFFGQAHLGYRADRSPSNALFVSSTETLAKNVVDRTYKMLGFSPRTRGLLLPERYRRQSEINLSAMMCYVGWARSPSTLADKSIRWGHGNEIDKWEHASTATEGDPLELYMDRGQEWSRRCFINEGTPSEKHRSRIERGRLRSWNCRHYVACQRCHKYQPLILGKVGEVETEGGIAWERTAGGKSDPDLARETARYICKWCHGTNEDIDRLPMMRSGVWVPEGCGVDHDKAPAAVERWHPKNADHDRPLFTGWADADWVTGTPARSGVDAGFHLSSLASLRLSWGDLAAEFVLRHDKPASLRVYINQWLAETWERTRKVQTWEQLGEKLIIDVEQGVIPRGFSILTAGIDKQDNFYVYNIDAWGPDSKSHTIDYGEAETLEEIFNGKLARPWPHEDGGEPLRVEFSLVDSGFRPHGVYEACRDACGRGITVWPCKGSNTKLEHTYRESILGDNTSMPGAPLVHVDTINTQDWIETQLYDAKREQHGCHTVFSGPVERHQDWLQQLLNDGAIIKDSGQEVWERIDEGFPNDYRDCRRYGFAAKLRTLKGRALPSRITPEQQKRIMSGGSKRPDGREWVPR